MRQNQQSQQAPYRSETDRSLERRGKMSDLTAADRAAMVRAAELLGCPIAAEHILADAQRRRLVVAAPEPAPRPGPKPKHTPARQPVMNLVHGGGEGVGVCLDARAAAYACAFDGLDRAAGVDGLDASQRSVFLRLRALAAAGAGRRPLGPAPSR